MLYSSDINIIDNREIDMEEMNFKIDFSNFANDCSLCMVPSIISVTTCVLIINKNT